jgi:hypothetical protein
VYRGLQLPEFIEMPARQPAQAERLPRRRSQRDIARCRCCRN